MEPLTIFTFFVALVLIAWGYLIGVRGNFSLIPLYATQRVKNQRGYAVWIGYNLMVMGILGCIDGLFQTLFPLTHVFMFFAYAAILVPVMSVRIIRGKRRFEVE
jgi:hypothetical protein